MLRAAALALRPPVDMAPSEFAARYRRIKEGTSAQAGQWSNSYFPYLTAIMDAVGEALRTGRAGVVLMKSGQGGGSEAMINALAWLLEYYPGPVLYLISKDEVAREFCRERFSFINDTCEPLKRKCITGRGSGELVHVKRYVDGKLVVQGGKSVLNLQSFPYRHVFVDEADSLQDEMDGQDPIALAEVRTSTYVGNNRIMIVFAHPTNKERGAGKLYYEKSDQRRGYVTCPHCQQEFFLSWDHVSPVVQAGLTQAQAERDSRCYKYFAPCCGAELTDSQRWAAVRACRQKSTLPEAEAKNKPWIGVHFSQLYMPNMPLETLAAQWVESLDDEPVRRVFVNKRLGDVYEAKISGTSRDAWRRLKCISHSEQDPEFYERGQVPAGVRFLTAGQDSRERELHWSVWGWGLVRDEAQYPLLCGWLIDYGVIDRTGGLRLDELVRLKTLDARELLAFNQLLYDRAFLSVDGKYQFYVKQGLHDSGWQPIAIYEYCRSRPFVAYPSKGAATDSTSTRQFISWGPAPAWRLGEEQVRDERVKLALLNTYTLKEAFYGLVEKSFKRPGANGAPAQLRTRLTLPRDVGEDFIGQASSEYKKLEKRKYVWGHRGPNHWADTMIYAYAAALNLDPFQEGLPFGEAQAAQRQVRYGVVGRVGS